MVRTRGIIDFNLDGGDAVLVETAVETTLADWFGAPEPHDYYVRSEASSVLTSGRLLSGAAEAGARRLQQLQWSTPWDVFVYEQQLDNVTATVRDLQTNAASVDRFAARLLVELENLGIGAGFSGFGFRSWTDPYLVSISQVSSTTTSSTSSTTSSTTSTSSTSSSSTSSTSTSSSSTSSSTTTTLFPLLLESAEMTQGYSQILLTFNERAMLTEDLTMRRLQEADGNDNIDCNKVFTLATMDLLGVSPSCTWLADGRILQVSLGTSPTITFSDSVETIDGALTTNRRVVDLPVSHTPSLSSQVFTNDPPTQPHAAVLASPLSVQACSVISVSAAASSGAAARPFVVSWALGNRTNSDLAQELQAKVDSATGTTLQISQLELFSAVQAVKQRMGSDFYSTPIRLEFAVSTTNWLGLSDQATAVVELQTSEEPMPIVTPTSALATTIYNSDPVAFSVQTLYADTSSCSNTSSTPRQIVVTWEYSENFGSYQSLSSLDLRDLDRSPGGISFSGYSFQSNTFHQFRVTAQYEGSSSAGARQYVFNLTVAPPAPPVARMVGPSSVSDACSFSLDASGSYDPSLQPGAVADLAFEWSCISETGDPCALTNFATPTATDGSGIAGAQITVTGGELAEGFYNFSVAVRRAAETEATVSTWQLEISGGALPPVSVVAPWSDGEAVSTQMGWKLGPTTASVQGSQGCTVPPTWAWRFVLVEDNSQSSILAFMSTSISGSDSITLSTSDFLSRFLIPGKRYYYAILQTATEADMDVLQGEPVADLGQALALGAKVVKSPAFLADGPPSGGIVQCAPALGYAVTTSFSGTTFAWYDEDVSSLTYAYYLLPFRQNITMTSDGNGGIVLGGEFQNPVVDWSNVSSPLYWSKQGGSFLKNVSDPQASQWDVTAPVGAYVMAAVARDRFGAVTAAYTPGPLVEVPPGGVSPDLAKNLLDNALTSGDETVILGALGSLSSVPVDSSTGAEAEAVTAKKLEALDAAAGVVGASPASLTMFGDVATSMLQSEGAGAPASAAVAEQASGALDTVLTAALDSEGIDAGAGTSLLKATTSVGDSFASSSSDSAVAQGARASKLRVLFSKLGSALAQQVPVGASTSISTVEGGKGTEIDVAKEDAGAAAESGVSSAGAQIPGAAVARRLFDCSSLTVQNTFFVGSNPFTYVVDSLGQNSYVASDATVNTLELKRCGVNLLRSNLDPPIELQLPLNPPPGNPPEGYVYEPVCVRLDERSPYLPNQEWTTDFMNWVLPASYDGTTLDCFAQIGGGSYAAIYLPLKLETTVTGTSTTTTRTILTTSLAPVEVTAMDGGLVFGVVLASIALVVVVLAIGFQCYGGVKVKVCNGVDKVLKQVKGTYQRTKEKMTRKPSKVDTEPAVPGTEPAQAWQTKPAQEHGPKVPGRQARSDAEDHFWDWANDLIKSTSQTDGPSPAQSSGPGGFSVGPPKVSSPPTLPPRFPARRPSADKEEYFQSFAQELREMVSAGIPGMIVDSQPSDVIPPAPPPKRAAPSGPPALPPAPPPRRKSLGALSLHSQSPPPALETSERVAVRVDAAYADWMQDFASVAALEPSARPPTSPPPPPPRQPVGQLPLPPPRPAIANKAMELKAPPPLSREANANLSDLRNFAKAPPLPAALADNLPLPPPPPPASHSQLSILSPPSLKAGFQLSQGLPKYQPLPPPLPKGASAKSTSSAKGAPPIQLPGVVIHGGEGSHTPRESPE